MIFKQKVLKQLAELEPDDIVKVSGDWNDKTEDFFPDQHFQILVNEECNTTRWHSQHNLVFLDLDTNKHYHVQYERGLTEYQMYSPFDDYKDGQDCQEVEIDYHKRVVIDILWKPINA